jgi:hypothetical protein
MHSTPVRCGSVRAVAVVAFLMTQPDNWALMRRLHQKQEFEELSKRCAYSREFPFPFRVFPWRRESGSFESKQKSLIRLQKNLIHLQKKQTGTAFLKAQFLESLFELDSHITCSHLDFISHY